MENASTTPSSKGSVFRFHVEHLLKLVSAGEISWEELSRHLEPSDLAILDKPVLATQWYDIRAYERVLLLCRDVEGDWSNECLLRYGAEAAQRLLEAGLYEQLNLLKQALVAKQSDPQARFLAFGRDLRSVIWLSANILNFSRFDLKVDPERGDRYVVEVSDADVYPEVLCWTTQGFMNRLATEHGHPDLWQWERPVWDRVVYRMTRSL